MPGLYNLIISNADFVTSSSTPWPEKTWHLGSDPHKIRPLSIRPERRDSHHIWLGRNCFVQFDIIGDFATWFSESSNYRKIFKILKKHFGMSESHDKFTNNNAFIDSWFDELCHEIKY